MELHLKIKELLEKRKDLEQKDLAQVLGVTPKQAHNYLNGHSKIIADHIPAIAKLLRVSINSLFDDKDISNEIMEEQLEYRITRIDCSECIAKQKEIEALKTALEAKEELLQIYRDKKKAV